jgi:hypothetical protein
MFQDPINSEVLDKDCGHPEFADLPINQTLNFGEILR